MIFFVCRLAVGMQSAARPTLALSSRAVLFSFAACNLGRGDGFDV